jgi:hypothetical protein
MKTLHDNRAFKVLHSRVGPWPYPQTLGEAGVACQGQTH